MTKEEALGMNWVKFFIAFYPTKSGYFKNCLNKDQEWFSNCLTVDKAVKSGEWMDVQLLKYRGLGKYRLKLFKDALDSFGIEYYKEQPKVPKVKEAKRPNYVSLPLVNPPKNCVELIIYDNDGPEGYFNRLQFERSSEAILYVIKNFKTFKEIKDFNFEIHNYWK